MKNGLVGAMSKKRAVEKLMRRLLCVQEVSARLERCGRDGEKWVSMKGPVGRPHLSSWVFQTFGFCWVCKFVYLKVLFSDFIDWGINILRLVKS